MGGPGSGPRKANLLKKIEGSWRTNAREPRVTIGLPPCPAGLGTAGDQEWQTLGAELVQLGVLATTDAVAFATYCRLVDQADHVRRELQEAVTGDDRRRLRHEERTIAKALAPFLACFGLTPVARGRIVAAPVRAADPDNPWR